MNLLWDLYWPVVTAAIVIGLNAGAIGFRKRASGRQKPVNWRRRRLLVMGVAIGLTLVLGAVWHGPVGSGERFVSSVERQSRQVLVDFEMEPVRAVIERDPLRRTLVLAGPADDFQRAELVRILDEVPGVANVRWTDRPAAFTLPLLLEVELAALVGFGLGLLLAYLLELRRRSRAQWRW